MELKGKTIGFAITGSHCTYDEIRPVLKKLVELGVTVVPILSYTVQSTNTRFAEADAWVEEIEQLTRQKPITTIVEAEPLGPSKKLDALLIAPCTGNTISRLANAMTDSPVLMAAKATMRNDRPVVLAISTNDGLGLNMSNIAKLMSAKNIFMVPFGQDDPYKKMNSLVARMDLVYDTLEAALEKKQLQPVLIERYKY
ncbi:dipicolinate synthase subunit B [Effusibacillus lacus]|uniref:Dipicolinate synthase subunit B n=1 Tax=Effusibacillus lacus TaxID=1348429 RepID=A0A292YDU1_9BACL|nr:dipicolinate synthase subunit B [Effusibacillus lacus]TCS73178.1 dipicolinate synthase subunit B [Effusibacillus lacus]GAX90582.1 dipicolinate synthase subunit B [Effusibacillus lacus]